MLVIIRPMERRDFATIASWFKTEAEVVQWGGTLVRYPLDTAQLNGMLQQTHEAPPARLCWSAVLDGQLIGHAQCTLDWRNGNATLARVAIAPASRGKRLAEPMLRNVLEGVFEDVHIQRVELNVFTWNHAAIRTYGRLGFQHEGVRRSSALVGSERWDTALMGILRHEWTGRTKR